MQAIYEAEQEHPMVSEGPSKMKFLVVMATLRRLGQDDADLHGLSNCRRSLAHIGRRIRSEGKLLFPGEFAEPVTTE